MSASKIDLMIVGAQKAGTTALKNYLNEHPQIMGHEQIEFAYFRDDTEYSQGIESAYQRYFPKVSSLRDNERLVAKNVGIYDNEKAIERLCKYNPTCKLVFVIREPVARAYSSYTMEVFNGWMKQDFSDIKNDIEKEKFNTSMYRLFVGLGMYANHLELIYKYFPQEQVKIILFDDFKQNTVSVCQDIFEWIGVDSSFQPNIGVKHNTSQVAKSKFYTQVLLSLRSKNNPIKRLVKSILPYSLFSKIGNTLIESNKSTKKANPISKEMYEYLHDYFAPYNKKLEQLTGLDLSNWSNKNNA